MSESTFNAEQQAHMRYLASIPRSERCASGWHLIGECYGEPCKPPDPRYTCAACGCGIRVCQCPAALQGAMSAE